MKVLVTGASGFLGSHIVDRCLALGDEVRVLVRPASDRSYLASLSPRKTIEYVEGALPLKETAARATRGVDVVYHAAARVTDQGRRKDFYDANVIATQVLLEEAKKSGVGRFVFVSSPSVVANHTEQLDIDESYPLPRRFVNLYSETKAIAEQSVLASNTESFITCALRPRGIWGPRDRTGFMPKIVARLRAQKLPDMSGGKRVLASLCHAENAAYACTQAARSNAVGGKAYFVTDREKTDVWALIANLAVRLSLPPIRARINPALLDLVARTSDLIWRIPALANNRSPPLSRYALGLLTLSATYDISAAERDFAYVPQIDQETGLSGLMAWIDEVGGVEEYVRYVR